ncbi:MAG: murein hydrolase activator EnvC family protein, partial [Endozoicomonas sp.]
MPSRSNLKFFGYRPTRYATLATLVAVLLTGLSTAAYSAGNAAPEKNSPTKTQAEADIREISSDIEHIKKMLKVLNNERTSAQALIQKNDEAISRMNREVLSLEKRLEEGQGEVKKLQSRQQALTARSEEQKQAVAASLRSLYLASGDSRIKLLLNQEDPEAVSRQLVYLEVFQDTQLKAVREFEQTIDDLNSVEQQQQALLTRLSQEKRQLAKRQKSLASQQAERKKLLAQLGSRYQSADKDLTRLELQRQKLEQVLASIKSQPVSGGRAFKTLKGKVPWPVKGKVLFGFNEKHPESRMRWQGMFIQVKAGSPVKAVHDGRIIFSDWLRGYGLLTIVDHGQDYLTLYAHNRSLLMSEGESVLAG